MKFTVNHHNQSALANCLQVAADRFKENADIFRKVAATGGNDMMTAGAADQMAVQFDRQALEARGFAHVFASLDHAEILYEHDEEDDENPFHPESPEGREWQREFDKMQRNKTDDDGLLRRARC